MKNTILTILSLIVISIIAIFAPDTNWYVYAGLIVFALILNIESLIKLVTSLFKVKYSKEKGLEIEEQEDLKELQ